MPEDQVAKGIDDHLAVVRLHPTGDVRVVSEDDVRSLVDYSVGEIALLRRGALLVLRAPVQRHHHVVHLVAETADVFPDHERVHGRHARPVGLGEGRAAAVDELRVTQEADPDLVPLDDERPPRIIQIAASTDEADTGAPEVLHGVHQPLALGVERVVVGYRDHVHTGPAQGVRQLGASAEGTRLPRVRRERILEVHEGDVGGAQQRRDPRERVALLLLNGSEMHVEGDRDLRVTLRSIDRCSDPREVRQARRVVQKGNARELRLPGPVLPGEVDIGTFQLASPVHIAAGDEGGLLRGHAPHSEGRSPRDSCRAGECEE